MSLQYIIDGYNIIRHTAFNSPKRTKDIRATFIEFIKTKKLCGSLRNEITIVFDGKPNIFGASQGNGNINVIFTQGETADTRIKKIVEQNTHPKNIVIVSNDKEIRFFASACGAKLKTVEEFIRPVLKTKDKVKQDDLKPELTYSQIGKINQELKKIWLSHP